MQVSKQSVFLGSAIACIVNIAGAAVQYMPQQPSNRFLQRDSSDSTDSLASLGSHSVSSGASTAASFDDKQPHITKLNGKRQEINRTGHVVNLSTDPFMTDSVTDLATDPFLTNNSDRVNLAKDPFATKTVPLTCGQQAWRVGTIVSDTVFQPTQVAQFAGDITSGGWDLREGMKRAQESGSAKKLTTQLWQLTDAYANIADVKECVDEAHDPLKNVIAHVHDHAKKVSDHAEAISKTGAKSVAHPHTAQALTHHGSSHASTLHQVGQHVHAGAHVVGQHVQSAAHVVGQNLHKTAEGVTLATGHQFGNMMVGPLVSTAIGGVDLFLRYGDKDEQLEVVAQWKSLYAKFNNIKALYETNVLSRVSESASFRAQRKATEFRIQTALKEIIDVETSFAEVLASQWRRDAKWNAGMLTAQTAVAALHVPTAGVSVTVSVIMLGAQLVFMGVTKRNDEASAEHRSEKVNSAYDELLIDLTKLFNMYHEVYIQNFRSEAQARSRTAEVLYMSDVFELAKEAFWIGAPKYDQGDIEGCAATYEALMNRLVKANVPDAVKQLVEPLPAQIASLSADAKAWKLRLDMLDRIPILSNSAPAPAAALAPTPAPPVGDIFLNSLKSFYYEIITGGREQLPEEIDNRNRIPDAFQFVNNCVGSRSCEENDKQHTPVQRAPFLHGIVRL